MKVPVVIEGELFDFELEWLCLYYIRQGCSDLIGPLSSFKYYLHHFLDRNLPGDVQQEYSRLAFSCSEQIQTLIRDAQKAGLPLPPKPELTHDL